MRLLEIALSSRRYLNVHSKVVWNRAIPLNTLIISITSTFRIALKPSYRCFRLSSSIKSTQNFHFLPRSQPGLSDLMVQQTKQSKFSCFLLQPPGSKYGERCFERLSKEIKRRKVFCPLFFNRESFFNDITRFG